jgi:hypothetical protein
MGVIEVGGGMLAGVWATAVPLHIHAATRVSAKPICFNMGFLFSHSSARVLRHAHSLVTT